MNIEAIEQEAHLLGKAGDRLAAIKTIRQALGSLTLAVAWGDKHYPKADPLASGISGPIAGQSTGPTRNHAREAYARIETRGLVVGRHPAGIENEIARAVNASRADLASSLAKLLTWAETYRRQAFDQPHPQGPISQDIDEARALLATLPQ